MRLSNSMNSIKQWEKCFKFNILFLKRYNYSSKKLEIIVITTQYKKNNLYVKNHSWL